MKSRKILFKSLIAFILVLATLLTSACGIINLPNGDDRGDNGGNQGGENSNDGNNAGNDGSQNGSSENAVTILYTNDIHAYLNNDANEAGMSYAELAKMKKDLGENVLLVDAGDHVQGSVYGAMDQGQSVLEIMGDIYDLATLGNHEFDYGIERTMSFTSSSKYPYISCNFVYKESGETVLEPHVMKTVGNIKVGFVGITTPETLTSTAPSYFQNEAGEFVYDFLDDEKLYNAVQVSIDALKNEGADYIIALGHVGVDALSEMTSRRIIENVSGLDAFIDGHSHTEIEKETVIDKSGRGVLLTQTGYYFGGVGKMTLSESGIDTEIVKTYETRDEAVFNLKNEWVNEVEQMLGEKIGTLGTELSVNDENGNRLVRTNGTAIGEFVADSYYYYVNFVTQIDCDVAIINGGGVRASIDAGDVSYMSLKSVNPFGNMICVIELTGQQILDMLEWASRITTGTAGQYEEGSFLHTAGLKYTVDTSVNSTVQKNEQDLWTGAPTGDYRVKNVMIYDKALKKYVDIDMTKTYRLAGTNYTLINHGGGFEMLDGNVIKDYIIEDYMALAAYAIAFDDVNEDGLSDISSENSPLRIYDGYGINYEVLEGDNRANVIKSEE